MKTNKTTIIFSGTFQEMQASYLNRKKQYSIIKKEIENKLEKLKKKEAENVYPHWTEYLVRPLMHEIARLIPDIEWEMDETLLCFGLRAECPVFGQNSEGITVTLNFTFRGSCLHYDTGKTKWNLVSDPNGFNNSTAPVESVDQLVAILRYQIENEKKALDKNSSSQ